MLRSSMLLNGLLTTAVFVFAVSSGLFYVLPDSWYIIGKAAIISWVSLQVSWIGFYSSFLSSLNKNDVLYILPILNKKTVFAATLAIDVVWTIVIFTALSFMPLGYAWALDSTIISTISACGVLPIFELMIYMYSQ